VRQIHFLCWLALSILASLACPAQEQGEGDDLASRLGLADLAAYRAALAGRATVDDARASEPPRSMLFRQLWDTPDVWRGCRVQVTGRIARVFRQEAVGSFPALVEAWLSTPTGDLICTVFPTHGDAKIGQSVDFTGTFLKLIRYSAGDQARLAPLVVGDRPPAPATVTNTPASGPGLSPAPGSSGPSGSRSVLAWLLGLIAALAAAGLLAWRHVRWPAASHTRGYSGRHKAAFSTSGDAPLEFIERESQDGTRFS
jgi:hypothetical protein